MSSSSFHSLFRSWIWWRKRVRWNFITFFYWDQKSGISDLKKYNIVFVFDGLDECRLPLDFESKTWCDVTKPTTVGVLSYKPHPGKSASLCSHLVYLPTCTSQSHSSRVCWPGERDARVQWLTEGWVLHQENDWSKPGQKNPHTHEVIKNIWRISSRISCATFQYAVGFHPLFWRIC